MIVPGPEAAYEADYRWLLHVGGAALPLIARRLPSLFGRGSCPACSGVFSVMGQLASGATGRSDDPGSCRRPEQGKPGVTQRVRVFLSAPLTNDALLASTLEWGQ